MMTWDEARLLVKDGEAVIALDLLTSFLKGRLQGSGSARVQMLLDTILLIYSRQRQLQIDSLGGVLTPAEMDAKRARSERDVLAVITEVELLDKFRPPMVTINLPDRALSEKLFGEQSHLRSVGWISEGLRWSSAVCRLTDGSTFGTGFRCRDDALITNHHVIESSAAATKFRAEFFFEEEAGGKLRIPLTVSLNPDRLFWTSTALDVTLVGHSIIAADNVAAISLSADIPAKVDDRVSIIQHPNGGPKQVAMTNNRIINFCDPYVHYMTDTLPGSSGSPVFADSWRVLAIHHAGGNVRKNARGDVIFANEGILISALLSDAGFRSAYLSP